MIHSSPPPLADSPLTCFFWSGATLRSRSVADRVLAGRVDIPTPPTHLLAGWQRDAADLGLEPGDVEPLALARTRARWPEYKRCVQAMADWTRGLGLANVLADAVANSDMALMVCRGARYHNDASQYGGAAFCNLFLSDDKNLDLHFPAMGLRLPLVRGSAVIFDTAQPHALVPRGASVFDVGDFAQHHDCSQFFLTWELSIEDAHVARALQIAFDTAPAYARQLGEAQVRMKGERVAVNPKHGAWCCYE